MSLILVVARALPTGLQQDARDGSELDRWAQVLSGGFGSGTDVVTVDYAAGVTDANAAAERAILAGNRNVALIPVTAVEGSGEGSGVDTHDIEGLQKVAATLASRHPETDVVVATTRTGASPSFTEVLSVLHAPDASDPQLLTDAVGRVFGGDVDWFGRFVGALQSGVPPGTQLALRGSAIQGYSYKTLEPFDAGGPGSSDLDVVLFGDDAMAAWDAEAFFLPGINTMPLGDDSRWVAPSIEPARARAQKVARRPVNIQAMARWFLDIRSGLQGTPYVLVDA
jgi:hypothetical protein